MVVVMVNGSKEGGLMCLRRVLSPLSVDVIAI